MLSAEPVYLPVRYVSPMNAVKDRSVSGKTVSGLANWNGDARSDFVVGHPGLISSNAGPGFVMLYYSKYYGSFLGSMP